MIQEIKKFFKDNEADIVLVVGVILISLMSFGGGWLMGVNSVLPQTTAKEDNIIKVEKVSPEDLKASTTETVVNEELPQTAENSKNEIPVETTNENQQPQTQLENSTNLNNSAPETQSNASINEKQIVASKNGEAYYYIWCSGVKRIKEENKVYFNSPQEAEAAGYRPAKNCPGLGE